jgi:hypothetical protein
MFFAVLMFGSHLLRNHKDEATDMSVSPSALKSRLARLSIHQIFIL